MSISERAQILQNIKPENVFRYFREICAVPHGSGNTKKISDYACQMPGDLVCGAGRMNLIMLLLKNLPLPAMNRKTLSFSGAP